MLNLYRRHLKACSKAGTRSQECPSKPKCPIHFEGIDGLGKRHKPQALKNPANWSGFRDWTLAIETTREMERITPPEAPKAPPKTVEDAIASFLQFKATKSDDVQRKARSILRR